MLRIEYTLAISGIIFLVGGLFLPKLSDMSAVLILAAYAQALTIRDLDKQDIW